ncbi:MAG: DUF4914 family protein [Candidatus Devosia symbiotica]|nr:DUF4914 family protein [Candidatus Devosia symbiotica]
MESFMPLTTAIGGILIGLATAVLWLGNGRIAGILGIFGQLLPPAQTVVWRLVFLAAIVISTFVVFQLLPGIGMGGDVPTSLAGCSTCWGIAAPV